MRTLWELSQCIDYLFQGVLRIEVLEAKDLIKKDIGVFKKGASDPYVILRGTVFVNVFLSGLDYCLLFIVIFAIHKIENLKE